MIPNWFRRSLLIARVNSRRQFRKAREHRWLGFFQTFTVVFGVVLAVGRLPVQGYTAVWDLPGGYVLGRELAENPDAVYSLLRGFAGLLFVLLVFLTILKEATEGAMESHVDSLLVAAGPRSTAAGGVLWSLTLTGLQFGPLVVAGAVAFGVGSGSPVAGLLVAVAGVALLLTAVPLGFLLALVARLGFRSIPVLREHRILVGAPLAIAYFGVFVRIRDSMALVAEFPVAWYADAALLATGVGVPARGILALAVAPVLAVGCGALSVPVGIRVWYGDAPRPAEDDRDGTPGVLATVPELVVSRPVAAVARTVWIRLFREPRTLVFTSLPIVVMASVGVEIAGQFPAAAPVVVAVYGAATAGMGATLNPLGAAGGGLPAALTAPGGGRYLVRGYLVSAALPGAPVVALLSAVAGVAVGLPLSLVVGVALLGAVLTVADAALSLGVGVALPNMEGLQPTGSGLRPPRLWATTAFLGIASAIGLPALLGVGWGAIAVAETDTQSTAVALGGMAITIVLAGGAGWVAYRRATAAIVEYTVG